MTYIWTKLGRTASWPPMKGANSMLVDHVKFYVADIEAETSWLVDGYGFAVQAKGSPDGGSVRSVELGANEVRLILVEPPPREIPATGPDHARTRIS